MFLCVFSTVRPSVVSSDFFDQGTHLDMVISEKVKMSVSVTVILFGQKVVILIHDCKFASYIEHFTNKNSKTHLVIVAN